MDKIRPLIRLSNQEEIRFLKFIQDTRANIIPNPKDTLALVLKEFDKTIDINQEYLIYYNRAKRAFL